MSKSKSKSTSASKIIEIIPTAEDLKEASNRAAQLGVLPNSFTGGRGRMTGFLGEVAFENYYKKCEYVGDIFFTHDYALDDWKIEIKSKTCSSKPKLEYTVSVNGADNKEWLNDIFFFTRVNSSYSRVWLLGWMKRENFLRRAEYKKAGESDSDGFTYRSAGYHLPIKQLRRPDSFLGSL
jgi:hypothetical protein